MEEGIELEYEGQIYSAYYIVSGDTVTLYLPDGTQRATVLNGGFKPESAVRPHLLSYARQASSKSAVRSTK